MGMLISTKPRGPARIQVHPSHITMASKCQIAWQRRYGYLFGCWHKKEVIPPNIALAVGTSVHKTAEKNLTPKLTGDPVMSLEEVADTARDFAAEQLEGELYLLPDDVANLETVKAEAIDLTVALSRIHAVEVAPEIRPVALEEKWVIDTTGEDLPFDLAGTVDIREESAIIDIKTKGQKPTEEAAQTVQMRCYAEYHRLKTKSYPELIAHDYLIKSKRLANCRHERREAKPEGIWMDNAWRRVVRFMEWVEAIKDGRLPTLPADPEHWQCRATYCGYHSTCDHWSGRL